MVVVFKCFLGHVSVAHLYYIHLYDIHLGHLNQAIRSTTAPLDFTVTTPKICLEVWKTTSLMVTLQIWILITFLAISCTVASDLQL